MAKNIGGTQVKAGFYWNTKSWEITVLSGMGGTLPGGPEDRFVKIPMPALLVLGPVMGALFVMFLPFINTLRGTSEFLSENVVEPVIKLNGYMAGLYRMLEL